MDAREQPFCLTREDSVFCVYNAAMRGRSLENVERWADYSFLLNSALDKLPSIECDVYRGLDQPLTQVSHEFKEGAIVWLPSVTSTTTERDTALGQFGKSGSSRPGTLLKIHVVAAKNIQVFSVFPNESELLLACNSCLKIELALTSQKVAKMSGFGTLPENVDLIVATQQSVSMDAIVAAVAKDKHDLEAFTQSQYNAQAQCIIISGAVGSACINGAYEPTSERHEGRVRYRMIGDGDKWIEHMNGDWCVKPAANKGKNKGWAWVKGGCALDACASRTWRVLDHPEIKDEPGVAIRFADKVSGRVLLFVPLI